MKFVALGWLACATIVFAADPPSKIIKKLGPVTWQPDTHKLTWVVQKGTVVDGEFVAASEERYEVSPEKASMALGDEHRGIDGEEAVSLHRLLDTLALYCAQSVAWWDRGGGEPMPPGVKRTAPEQPPRSEPPSAKPSKMAARAAVPAASMSKSR